MKEELLNKLMLSLSAYACFDTYQLSVIKNSFYVLLENYELTPTKYEVSTTVYNDDQLIKMFVISKKIDGLSDRSIDLYHKEITRLLHMYIQKSCVEFTKDDIRMHFAKRMIDRPDLSKATLNNERRYLSTFFNWLTENDYIKSNPMVAVKKVKEDKVIKYPIDEKDIEKMRDRLTMRENNSKKGSIAYIKAIRDEAIFEFLLSTGCRVSELTGAKLKDLDLNNREIKVFGKGAKERICYLNAKSVIKLENYLKLRNDNNPYVFIPVQKNHADTRLHKSAVEIMVRELGKECGVEKVHPHRFRRTTATMALNKGMPIEEVQVMLGHEEMNTTMIYAKVKEKNVKASHEKYM